MGLRGRLHRLCARAREAARLDLAAKHAQVAPAFNKGAPQFVGGASFKSNALDAGRKTTAVVLDAIPDVARPEPRPSRARRRRVGTMWTANGDCFVLYEGDDPIKRGAVRHVYQ